MESVTTHTAATHRNTLASTIIDGAAVAGLCLLILSARALTLPEAPAGLALLAMLATIVRAMPIASGRDKGFVIASSTPVLATIAVYGTAWAVIIMSAALLLFGLTRMRRQFDLERLVYTIAHGALAAWLAGSAFSAAGGVTGHLSLAELIPPLFAAEAIIVAVSWLCAASGYIAETSAQYREISTEGLLGTLPVLVSEPVLALLLTMAVTTPTAATIVAAALPLAAFIVALRLFTFMYRRMLYAYAALNRAHEQLRIQATTDALTGLANRRHFEETLAMRLEEAGRYKRPLAVLLLDLDGFKGVNDTYGHAAGDAVLVGVGEALCRALRRTDMAARLGGDEFVALLPETDARRALALAQRVRAEIASLEIAVGSATVRPSASIGAASTEGHASFDMAALMAAADKAAYRAKAAGKNTAALPDDLTPHPHPARQPVKATS